MRITFGGDVCMGEGGIEYGIYIHPTVYGR
jgi:hypothetical protein